MFKWIKEVFSDESGRGSSMRVFAFELINVGLFIAVYAVIMNRVTMDLSILVFSLIGAGLTGKVAQKFAEDQNAGPK